MRLKTFHAQDLRMDAAIEAAQAKCEAWMDLHDGEDCVVTNMSAQCNVGEYNRQTLYHAVVSVTYRRQGE